MSNQADEKTQLSDFFSVLSKEKDKTRKELKEKIENPESGLSTLFSQLEGALLETQKVSEEPSPQEISEEKNLTAEDQKKIEIFSNLVQSFDSEEEIPEEVEIEKEEEILFEPVEQLSLIHI